MNSEIEMRFTVSRWRKKGSQTNREFKVQSMDINPQKDYLEQETRNPVNSKTNLGLTRNENLDQKTRNPVNFEKNPGLTWSKNLRPPVNPE